MADKTSSLSSKTITVNELIQQGYLNNGFSRSPFGHSYITGIRKIIYPVVWKHLPVQPEDRILKKMGYVA